MCTNSSTNFIPKFHIPFFCTPNEPKRLTVKVYINVLMETLFTRTKLSIGGAF